MDFRFVISNDSLNTHFLMLSNTKMAKTKTSFVMLLSTGFPSAEPLKGSTSAVCVFMAFRCFTATPRIFFHVFFWTSLEIIVAGLWNKPSHVMKFHSLQHLLFSWGICLSGIYVSLVLVISTSHVFMKKLRAERRTHNWRFSATHNCLKLQSTHQLVVLFPYWNAHLLLHVLRIIGVILWLYSFAC